MTTPGTRMGLLHRLRKGLAPWAEPGQLSLFGPDPRLESPGDAAPTSPPPAVGVEEPQQPVEKVLPSAAPSPSIWQHPSANRAVTLGQREVGYLLRRARRRTIGFLVSPEGLIVSASRWVGQADIDRALQAKGDWIVRKLHEQGDRVQRQIQARVFWRDGECLPYLGQTLQLKLDPDAAGVRLEPLAHDPVAQWALRLDLPSQASAQQWRERVQAWLQQQALTLFRERCDHFAPRLGVEVKSLKLSTAQTRWGSARVDGSIRLNWRLIHFALPVIDYVVVHELAHLREMNHSAAFWDVVRSAVPDFEQARQPLQTVVLPVMETPEDAP